MLVRYVTLSLTFPVWESESVYQFSRSKRKTECGVSSSFLYHSHPVNRAYVSHQLSTCKQCGKSATILETYGLLNPDPQWPGVRVLEVISCPRCGICEQPNERIPRSIPSDSSAVSDPANRPH